MYISLSIYIYKRKKIYLSNLEINTIFSPKNVDFSGIGKYSFDELNQLLGTKEILEMGKTYDTNKK